MNEEFQRIGLIVNSAAGRNAERAARAGSRAISALGATEVVTGPGAFGEDALRDLDLKLVVRSASPGVGRDSTRSLARTLAELELETVIVVGGDGTMADVASVFAESSHQPKILGIGAGSTNAGALITCLAEEVECLNPKQLEACTMDALIVSVLGGPSAIAFNDCIFSTTVVGTLDDSLVDLDAAALLEGRRELASPRPVGEVETIVRIVGQGSDEHLSNGMAVATIVVGFAERAFRAKAVTGGICLATHVGIPAGCLVADQPLAYVDASAATLIAGGPIKTAFMTIDAERKVIVSGTREGATVCADGNPVAVLHTSSEVEVKLVPSAITGLTIRSDN